MKSVNKDERWLERIQCPMCECVQDAEVVFQSWMPFPAYVQECRECAYMITESEWNKVGTFEERSELMRTIGIGGCCLIDGEKHKLLRFDVNARIYEFTNPHGRWWMTGDDAFSKGLHTLGKA